MKRESDQYIMLPRHEACTGAESKSVLQFSQMAFDIAFDRFEVRYASSDGENDVYIGVLRALFQLFCNIVLMKPVGLTHQSFASVAVRSVACFLAGNKPCFKLSCTILYNEKTGINNGARKAFTITEYPVKYTCAP